MPFGAASLLGGQPDPNTGFGVLFYAMIYPFAVGPMALAHFIWWQGENNSRDPVPYACQQVAMIKSWRRYFNNPSAFFGFVEIEPYIGRPHYVYALPELRDSQLASLTLPNVGYATAIDIGDELGPFGSIHPRNKKLVGARLAAAARALAYNESVTWRPPAYASHIDASNGTLLTVRVTLDFVPTTLVLSADYCNLALGVPEWECGWPSITASDGNTYNASVTLTSDAKGVVVSATANKTGLTARSMKYAYAPWPVNLIFSAEGLPVRPWNVILNATV